MLVVLAKKRESTTIFRIIQTIDPGAFVSQTLAHGVFGYGFDKIKVKPKADKGKKLAATATATAITPPADFVETTTTEAETSTTPVADAATPTAETLTVETPSQT